MIDGLKRRFAKSNDKDPWDANQELEPEVEGQAEVSTDKAVLIAATQAADVKGSNDVDTLEYYKGLVKTAIGNGGKYNGHEIPIPWLRMILAGLESRQIDPEMMWYGYDETGMAGALLPEMPTYNDFFPADGDVQSRPGPR